MASILALGDSYTIGEGVLERENYPNQFAEFLNSKKTLIDEIKIIAKTGWRTDNLLDAIRLENIKQTFDYVFLLIGVNNQYQNRNIFIFENELKLLIEQVKLFSKNQNHAHIISIPNYGFSDFGKPFKQKITLEIQKYNQIIKTIALENKLKFIDITPISETIEKQYYAADELHPSDIQYQKWVKQILKQLKN